MSSGNGAHPSPPETQITDPPSTTVNPWPSGPSVSSRSPGCNSDSSRVPAPTASKTKPQVSSWVHATLNGRRRSGVVPAPQRSWREGPGHRGCSQVGQSHDQLQESLPEPLHHKDLAGLERGPAQIRSHDTACTTPSRYSRTVATRTLFPEVCRPIASTSATAVSSDVQHGMRRCSAASLIR